VDQLDAVAVGEAVAGVVEVAAPVPLGWSGS
jgi:hypothetical protein